MLSFLKRLPKRLLKRFNRTLCYTSYPITGCHFPDDLRLVVGKTAPLCFDVGAHWGETIQEFQTIFADPIIHAFEPAAANYQVVRQRHQPPRTFVHPFALAELSGEKTFTLYADTVLNSFLEVNPEGPQGAQKAVGSETVRMRTLDDFAAEHQITEIDLLKVDTQGFEMQVLQGAEKALSERRIHALLLEVNFSRIYEGQSAFSQLLDHLDARGYGLVDFYQKARVGHRLSWCNAMFVRLP